MIFLLRRYKAYWPFLLLVLLGLYNVYGNAFIQDEAYNSYNYAKWFSRGYGLVWYPGSTEFGYLNFLYTLMIGIGMVLRIPPEITSGIINTGSFIGALVMAYAIACRVLRNHILALIPAALLVTHHSFTAYATGGLETMWVTLLVLVFYWHVISRGERSAESQHLRLGAIAALLLLSRLDSAILLLPGYAWQLWGMWRDRTVQLGLAIPAVVTLGFLLCCYLAYGHALPNVFYHSLPDRGAMLRFGLRYLILYNALQLYLPFLVPALLLYFFVRKDSLRRMGMESLVMALVILLWLGYLLVVGGDSLEFRALVPILPFFYIVVFRIILTLLPKRQVAAALGVALAFLCANATHATLFATKPTSYDAPAMPKPVHYASVESTEMLNDWLTYDRINWRRIGRELHALFPNAPDLRIAATATGAISFYSDLRVFDIFGRNARIVEISHDQFLARVGRSLKATDALIEQEGIHLNLGHPQALCMVQGRYTLVNNTVTRFPSSRHQTLFLPLANGCFVVADYVTPHPAIDALIARRVIIRYRNVRQRTQCPAWLCLN